MPTHARSSHQLNFQIADKLRQMADTLDAQGEAGFRTSAYRRAADTVGALERPVDEILAAEGKAGLVALPTIGEGIAAAIAQMALTGRWPQLERLTGALEPERLFQTIPGIGPNLSARLHDELGIESLEQLELAAYDGRLESVSGVGARRAAAIRALLKDRLARRIKGARHSLAPPVAMLLDIDQAYRRRAAAGELKKIAPRRFNPTGEAWLPVLHENQGAWRFTALHSNTAAAHRLGKTGDWVVIYYETDGAPEGQCTVVTESQGPLKGARVVRGREQESAAAVAERIKAAAEA